ncbi:hypothetical protein [Moraxella bovis]|uniref:YcxB-like protein domain-containing protein n=2 Tax=Moraxella bovis TaxID=476 RepID=A0ABY6M5F1_MORBO|nr:hypothetical protein [Moraxella bovis]OOR90333.1 hypothetical protein B0182_05510 [Moraxella bovis]UYZ69063.1 hypothetical protein LP122_02920 [Moraxella bovis]UYZ71437.1 hypothetical protein LP089_02975 [Moraxella bovis]UYZ72650.1 hypothetical protein LP105_09685 [Moraxella bovis]UZA02514.1 hypothetical protein LP092_11200 [Moraxella bovis]
MASLKMANLNKNSQMQSFVFKDKTFDFPIEVYPYFLDKVSMKAFIVIMILTALAMIFISIITENTFGIWLFAFVSVALLIISYAHKKPRFIIEKDKLILVEHGFIKPKELYWKDCILYPTFNKSNATGQEIPLLHFLYKNNNGEMERFSWLGLKQIRFNEHHFDKDDTLKFFENIKSLSEKQ